MIPVLMRAHVALLRAFRGERSERGQTTAEYALVLLGAASIALLVLAWANQTDKVTQVLNAIMDNLLDQIS